MQRPTELERLGLFQRAEKELSAALESCDKSEPGVPPTIDQRTLDLVRVLFRAFDRKGGKRHTVPADINVNLNTGLSTDLPPGDLYPFVARVPINDVLDADCLLRLDEIGPAGRHARRAVIDLILRTIRARINVTNYVPREEKLGSRTYRIHNDFAMPLPQWGVAELSDMLAKLKEVGIFGQAIHDARYGLPFTSETKTNPDMLRQWLIDSCMAGMVQRVEAPHLWPRNLVTNAGFLCTQPSVDAMLQSVANPEWYRKGDARTGIAHIFLPTSKNSDHEGLRWDEANQVPFLDSIKEDPAWFNRKRLESQALLMLWLIRTIKAGAFLDSKHAHLLSLGMPWGFRWDAASVGFPAENAPLTESQKQYIVTAIQVAASYLLAVEWDGKCYDFNAPSASAWEEVPLPGGCASDTGFMVDAFTELRDLLFNVSYDSNPIIRDVRHRLNNIQITPGEGGDAAEIGDAASLLVSRTFADFRDPDNLSAFIAAGTAKIGAMVVRPVVEAVDGLSRPIPSNVMQFPSRGPDSSLAVLASSFSRFDSYGVRDARIRLHLILFCEAHLMDSRRDDRFGMKRYGVFGNGGRWLMDSYLNYYFNLGSAIPALVVPSFARAVAAQYESVAEHYAERQANGTLSPRDVLLHNAYQRFVSCDREDLSIDPRKDAHDADSMAERQQFSFPDCAAQWSIGPTAAIIALAKAKYDLLSHLHSTVDDDDREAAQALLEETDRALTRFLNLVVTTIVQNVDSLGNEVLRADGTPLPAKYNLMEAFQVMPDVHDKVRFMPGDHSLPWSAAQLYEGLTLAIAAARLQTY